ncbi:TPA: hypothetical protein ACXIMI_002148 [Stenotrophomonas maltophilia]
MRAAALLLLLVLGGLIFSPGLGGGFLFDDQPNLVEDPDWKLDQLSWDGITQMFGSGIASAVGRPLAMLSFAVNHVFTGTDPMPLKATGLAMHLLNALLVWLLVSQLLVMRTTLQGKARSLVAWVVAFVWMVHPLQVSSALYIVQRMEVGAATGILLSLLCYLRARGATCDGRLAWPWWLGVVLASGFGLGFKETALLLPGYSLLLEVFVLRFAAPTLAQQRLLVGAYVIGGLGCLVIFFGWVVPSALSPTAYATRDFSLSERLYSQLPALLLYLRQMLLPWPESLWFYYDNFPISHGLLHPVSTLVAALILLGLALGGWLIRMRWPLTAFGIAWFFVSHALTSNVHPLELVFEHRNYLALLGVVLALIQPLQAALKSATVEARTLLMAPLLAYVGAMGCIQALSWGDPTRLALTLTTRNPESPRAGYEYGRQLLALSGNDPRSPSWSMAVGEFEHAAALPDSSPLADQALIVLGARGGNPVSDPVWKRFAEKLLRRPAGPQELSAVEGVVECRVAGNCTFADEQRLFHLLVEVVQRNPRSSRLRAIYANYAFNVMQDPDLAMRMIREAVMLSPRDPGYRMWQIKMGLASDLLERRDAEEALDLLRRFNGRGTYTADIERLEQWQAGQARIGGKE